MSTAKSVLSQREESLGSTGASPRGRVVHPIAPWGSHNIMHSLHEVVFRVLLGNKRLSKRVLIDRLDRAQQRARISQLHMVYIRRAQSLCQRMLRDILGTVSFVNRRHREPFDVRKGGLEVRGVSKRESLSEWSVED